MIRSVIFDLDCTLVDRNRSIDVYLEHFVERFGKALKAIDKKAIRAALGTADAGGYAADTRAGNIIAALDWQRAPTAAAVNKHWHSTFPECSVAMEDAIRVLEELRGEDFALGILTNGSVQAQESKIAHLGLDSRVDAVIVSEAIGVKKPDARAFEAVLEALETDAEDAVCVGDHPVNDVQGALDAGLAAIWMRGWQDWPSDLEPTEFVVDHLSEVQPMILQLP